jgi:predicted ATPase
VLRDGLEVPPGVTFLVGENGSGKSTLVEAVAAVYPRRGALSPEQLTGPGPSAEDAPLRRHLRAETRPMASPHGFFLRAELMHGYLRSATASPGAARAWGGEDLMAQSYGESFLAVLRHRFGDVGVYLLDEPESALSFRSCLALLALLHDLRSEGSQVLCATHSPLLASLPGATLLEVGDHGLREVTYDALDLVQDWRSFLDAPGRFLRHLLAGEVAGGEPG